MYNNKNNNNNNNKKMMNNNNNKSNNELYIYTHTQRIRGADTTLDNCWADIVDGGPTLNQHRAIAPCPQDKKLYNIIRFVHIHNKQEYYIRNYKKLIKSCWRTLTYPRYYGWSIFL